jgi:hypothetical protein
MMLSAEFKHTFRKDVRFRVVAALCLEFRKYSFVFFLIFLFRQDVNTGTYFELCRIYHFPATAGFRRRDGFHIPLSQPISMPDRLLYKAL